MRPVPIQAIVLALLLASVPAQAETLKYLTSDVAGADLYIDTETIRRMPPIPVKRPFAAVQVWTIYDYSKVRREQARQARALLSFNCQRRTMAILAYVKRRPDGRPIQDWRAIDYDFKYQPAEADTMTAFVMAELCGFAPPLAMVPPPIVPPPLSWPPPTARPFPPPPVPVIPRP
ncbi:MAG: hypothetical protein RL367_356 [Pseudomonadota bacterium]|jgi:hypothetical protein